MQSARLITFGVKRFAAEGFHDPRSTEMFQHLCIYHLCMIVQSESNLGIPDLQVSCPNPVGRYISHVCARPRHLGCSYYIA